MSNSLKSILGLIAFCAFCTTSCMVLDGGNAHRKKNKCCGIIKCDMHRASQKRKHKRTVTAHRSMKKREKKIKRGY